MIPFFPYREPKLLSGAAEIANTLCSHKIGKAMLFVSRSVRAKGLTSELEALLTEKNIAFEIYDGVRPDPTSENVEKAREIYQNCGCEAIIAFGGGSVIDCAKAVGARIVRPKLPLRKMAGIIKVRRRLPPFIAVPTTAGTGSEVTVASVIVDAETHHKYVINDFSLIPHYAALLPEVTVGLPPHLTATTGMDALTHAVEAYIGRSRTRQTKKQAEEAVKLILENLERAYDDGSDISARENMLRASYLAGCAFTKSYVGYVHAIAHTLGGKYGVAHGLANAILLPKVLRAYGDSVTASLARLAEVCGIAVSGDRSASCERFIARIEKMNEKMQIHATFDCILREDIPLMAATAEREANPLYPVPALWRVFELSRVYETVSGR
jgi:alcohol dehydrogenase class IV